jgi:hypothetical protein NreA
MEASVKHASHPAILLRLKRAHGHLKSVIEMIEAARPCLEIAQQLHAVEAAVSAAKRELIYDHIEHCLEADAAGEAQAASLRELKALSRHL